MIRILMIKHVIDENLNVKHAIDIITMMSSAIFFLFELNEMFRLGIRKYYNIWNSTEILHAPVVFGHII